MDSKREEVNLGHVYEVMRGLYLLRDYELLEMILIKYNVSVCLSNWNNDENLLDLASQSLDRKGLEWMMQHGASPEKLAYTCATAMKNYENHPVETKDWIDFILRETQVSPKEVYHRSLTWNYVPIHQHLLTHWRDRLDLKGVHSALEICGRFGVYEPVKFVIEHDMYRGLLTQEDKNKCLHGAIWVDCAADSSRYKLIAYLVQEQHAEVSDPHVMSKVTTFSSAVQCRNFLSKSLGCTTG